MSSINLHSISDDCLLHLLQEFSALDTEIAVLIRFLLDVRSLQERLAEVGGRTHLEELSRKIEDKIAQEIIIAMLVQGLSCPMSPSNASDINNFPVLP